MSYENEQRMIAMVDEWRAIKSELATTKADLAETNELLCRTARERDALKKIAECPCEECSFAEVAAESHHWRNEHEAAAKQRDEWKRIAIELGATVLPGRAATEPGKAA